MCKRPITPVETAPARVGCPKGFKLQADEQGVAQCVKQIVLPCPPGTLPGKNETQCCPLEKYCVPSLLGGLCPLKMVPRTKCPETVSRPPAAAQPSSEEQQSAAGRKLLGGVSTLELFFVVVGCSGAGGD